jgi:hypothetical protein
MAQAQRFRQTRSSFIPSFASAGLIAAVYRAARRSCSKSHRPAGPPTAELALATLKLTMPTLIDGDDNAVNRAYAGWPDRLYVIGVNGRVAYQGAPGAEGVQGRGSRGLAPEEHRGAVTPPGKSPPPILQRVRPRLCQAGWPGRPV